MAQEVWLGLHQLNSHSCSAVNAAMNTDLLVVVVVKRLNTSDWCSVMYIVPTTLSFTVVFQQLYVLYVQGQWLF